MTEEELIRYAVERSFIKSYRAIASSFAAYDPNLLVSYGQLIVFFNEQAVLLEERAKNR